MPDDDSQSIFAIEDEGDIPNVGQLTTQSSARMNGKIRENRVEDSKYQQRNHVVKDEDDDDDEQGPMEYTQPVKGGSGPRGSEDHVIPTSDTETLLSGSEGRRRSIIGIGGGVEGPKDVSAFATPAQKRAIWWKNVIITGCFIACWYTFATLLSLYNKWMFSPQYYGFSFPLFVTFCHMLVQWFLAVLIRASMPQFRPTARPTRQDYVSKIFPTAAATGGDIGLSNLSLKTITLSLYTMCKSSSLIFVLLFAFLFHLEKFSIRLIAVISFISFGVFLMVFDTTDVSIPGILMVFSASAIGGLRWALTSLLMHTQRMGMTNPFATIYWLAPLMALTLGFVSLLFEGWGNVFGSGFFHGIAALKTIGVIALPGGIAFSMVASEYFIIQRAGVVPMSIAGIFKEVTTITISAWIFGDELTELNIIGVVITVGGIALYSYHKYRKTVNSDVPLDSHGNPIETDAESASEEHNDIPTITLTTDYRSIPAQNGEEDAIAGSPSLMKSGVPLSPLHHEPETSSHIYPPIHAPVLTPEELAEERAQKRRDEFEGWGDEDEEDDEEDDIKEIARQRDERIRLTSGSGTGGGIRVGKSWGAWWDQEM